MNEPEDDFGAELAQITGQFLALAQLAARSGGFRDKPYVRGLLKEMKTLGDDTVTLSARTYPGSRPGKFLRDWDTSALPPRRWLDSIVAELTSVAAQIV